MTSFLATEATARGQDVQRWVPPRVSLEMDLPLAAAPSAPTSDEIRLIEETARRAGAEAGFREGYEAGYREGREQAEKEAEDARREREARELDWRVQEEQTLRATVAALEGIARELADPLASSADALEPELLALVSTLARRVVMAELATRPELIERVLHVALEQLPSRKHALRVRIHPDDQRILETYAEEHGESITWIADPALEPGGCILESGPSRIDASLEVRLRQGIDAIWGELSPPEPASGDEAIVNPAKADAPEVSTLASTPVTEMPLAEPPAEMARSASPESPPARPSGARERSAEPPSNAQPMVIPAMSDPSHE